MRQHSYPFLIRSITTFLAHRQARPPVSRPTVRRCGAAAAAAAGDDRALAVVEINCSVLLASPAPLP